MKKHDIELHRKQKPKCQRLTFKVQITSGNGLRSCLLHLRGHFLKQEPC